MQPVGSQFRVTWQIGQRVATCSMFVPSSVLFLFSMSTWYTMHTENARGFGHLDTAYTPVLVV